MNDPIEQILIDIDPSKYHPRALAVEIRQMIGHEIEEHPFYDIMPRSTVRAVCKLEKTRVIQK